MCKYVNMEMCKSIDLLNNESIGTFVTCTSRRVPVVAYHVSTRMITP